MYNFTNFTKDHACMNTRKYTLPAVCLSIFLFACGTSPSTSELPEVEHVPTSSEIPPSIDLYAGDGLVGHWWATDLTINGMRDPEMDPTNKVRWHIAADSSFSMWDATEGSPDSMNGRWSLEKGGSVFRILDLQNQEVTPFAIVEVGKEGLKLKVLEDAEGEVLLHFARR
jgi:hypothetical protein